MNAILAVDGGQSGIRMRHSSSARIVEVNGVIRSSDTIAAVAHAISEAWADGGFPPVERAILGLTTAPSDAGEADRLCELVATATAAHEVWLADDTVTAHCGALSGDAGMCLVVGTGVACLAVPDSGRPRVFDGHGYLLGDEGGAFWIGRHALRIALREHDRQEIGPLAELVRARFGPLDGLHIQLHETESRINDIAQFAKDILDASSTNAAAARLVDAAAAHLFSTVMDALAVFSDENVPLALGGRLLEETSPLRERLNTLLANIDQLTARSADGTPLDGALRLGKFSSPGQYRELIHVWKEEEAA